MEERLEGRIEYINIFTYQDIDMSLYLVVQLARFGDLVQTKRLMLSLLQEPQSEVHLCIDRSLVDLARLLYPKVHIHGIAAHAGAGGTRGAEIAAFNRPVFQKLQSIGFSKIFNINYSGMSFAVAGLFPSERVVGYRRENGQRMKDEWSSILFRLAARRKVSPVNLADLWGLYAPHPISPDAVNPDSEIKQTGKIGVVMAGRDSKRSLPPEILAPIAAAYSDKHGKAEVVLLGGKEDTTLAKAFQKATSSALYSRTLDKVGRTGWAELIDILMQCEVVLTPDTGTMHLAAHLGTKVVAFFLASAWAYETGPYGNGHTVFQSMTGCGPCLESQDCHNDLECLQFFEPRNIVPRILGKTSKDSGGLHELKTETDPLGIYYVPKFESVEGESERQDMRAVLSEYFSISGYPYQGKLRSVEWLFQEKDWILQKNQDIDKGKSGLDFA